ncbi:hypothetical protein [Hymenobacter guriensis]|uniref:PorT family protein n=1 Tax=Hymenobacter guriensis TaxID=2793065 RepID=A0ABS0L8D8_9BACT|nr:hypothetical protein [Hymenobacter guriensis]MBG8556387.1 hypothetical protein [Hymenobacter guriensis]
MRLILTFLLALVSTCSFAQSSDFDSPVLRKLFGFHVGYSQFHLSGSDADLRTQYSEISNQPLRSITAGIAGRQQLFSVLYLQEELNYVSKGGQFKNSIFISDKDPIIIRYLEAPVTLRLMLPTLEGLFIHVEGGAALNIALNQREINLNNYVPNTTFEQPNFIVAPVLGAGLDFQYHQQIFSLDMRRTWDTKDFFSRSFGSSEYSFRHQGFTITAGMLLGK